MNQVMSAQVSLGSQPQYLPQAKCAHTEPVTMPKVNRMNPALRLFSSMSASVACICSEPFFTRKITPKKEAMKKAA